MIWINILIGLILLFAGRRLFWLFVACVGFASGYHYAQQIWAIHSPVLVLILSIAAGALGAIIAIFFQKAAIVIAGFAAGGYIVLDSFRSVCPVARPDGLAAVYHRRHYWRHRPVFCF